MSARSDLDRSISEWLVSEAPDRAPERVLEASRERIGTTPQSRASWPAWRVPPMNMTVRFIAAAAAVGVLALIGFQLFAGSGVGAPAASPTSTAVASTEPTSFTELEGEGTELEPGEYVIDSAAPVALVTFTVLDESYGTRPSAWYKARYDWGPEHQSNAARIGAVDVEDLYVDPCDQSPDLVDPPLGPSVDDLIAGLNDVSGLEVSDPVAVQISGFSGQLVELTGEVRTDCAEDRVIWLTTQGRTGIRLPGAGDSVRAWILDISGERLVIFAEEDAGFPDPESLESLIDTIVIEAP